MGYGWNGREPWGRLCLENTHADRDTKSLSALLSSSSSVFTPGKWSPYPSPLKESGSNYLQLNFHYPKTGGRGAPRRIPGKQSCLQGPPRAG